LDPHSAGAQHLWHNGSTDSTLEVVQADTVWLAATNSCGLFADTLQVTAREVPVVNLGADTVLCTGSSVAFDVAFPWAQYAWNDGTAAAEHTIGSTGNWSVTVTASCGMAADTVHIRIDEPLAYSLGPDREACEGDTVLVAPALPDGTTFRWNTGSTAPELAITASGRYWLQAGNACGTYPDTVRATLFGKPQLALGNDTVICEGSALTLRTDRHAQAYAWNTGHAGPTLQVTNGGTYRVTATNTCGQAVDSVGVAIRPSPVIDLGRDTSWCDETPLVLTLPDDPEWTYAWASGLYGHSQAVAEPGVYAVTVTDAWSCQAQDAVTISECPVAVFIPNAFSPNHEPPNDVFLPKGHGIATFDMEIFNRWGKLLFRSGDVYEGWDGTHQGIAVPIGNYVCRVRYTDATGREFQRIETIALVR
ncbi:MAG: T9SS type B sorting domain-containing protein, partial [Bacteroidota bacterium]